MATKDTQHETVEMQQRDEFLTQTERQLEAWRDQLKYLKKAEQYIRPSGKLSYHHQLHAATEKLDTARRKLQTLRLAGKEEWPALKLEMDQHVTGLQHDLDEIQVLADKAKHDALTWAQGQASEHDPKSIGWGEGFAEEDKTKSIGWAEGFAEEDPVESKGWGEGYDREE